MVRPHNSGHHSIESCFTSQYEQHLWAVVGLPLGDPSMKTPVAMMYNILVSASPPTTQTQKPSIHLISRMPMQVPFHQPQLSVQFGGPNLQLQSQGTMNTSLPMPLPMGNPSQVQQQVFVQGLQPHLMQAQGIMHQGHAMNFSSQMGTHLGFFAHA